VIVSGPHRLAPIEIHAGRPILYGLGNFIWSDMTEPLQGYFYRYSRAAVASSPDPAMVTDADLTGALNAESFDDEEIFRAVVATIGFEAGAVGEIRLHPVELGFGEPLTRSGIPRTASVQAGEEILERVRAISEPLGTRLTVDGGLGLVHA